MAASSAHQLIQITRSTVMNFQTNQCTKCRKCRKKRNDVGNVEKKEEVLFMEKNVHIFIGAFYIKESIKCGFMNQLHFIESFIKFR